MDEKQIIRNFILTISIFVGIAVWWNIIDRYRLIVNERSRFSDYAFTLFYVTEIIIMNLLVTATIYTKQFKKVFIYSIVLHLSAIITFAYLDLSKIFVRYSQYAH